MGVRFFGFLPDLRRDCSLPHSVLQFLGVNLLSMIIPRQWRQVVWLSAHGEYAEYIWFPN
jgi:hypothetical protein